MCSKSVFHVIQPTIVVQCNCRGLQQRSPEVARKETTANQQLSSAEAQRDPQLSSKSAKKEVAMHSNCLNLLIFIAYLTLAVVHAPLDFLAEAHETSPGP